jgi:hypothetical protein
MGGRIFLRAPADIGEIRNRVSLRENSLDVTQLRAPFDELYLIKTSITKRIPARVFSIVGLIRIDLQRGRSPESGDQRRAHAC